MATPTIFQQVKNLKSTVIVGMNDVRFVAFHQHGTRCLATEGLNSCSVVAIAASSASILAHIAPRPTPDTNPTDPYAGDLNVEAKMREFQALFLQHRDHFAPDALTIVVSAFHRGKVALPDQTAIIERSLAQLGLSYAKVAYHALKSRDNRSPAHGTVVIDAQGGVPTVYVEDRRVTC
jgi:hypothetical protein